MQKKLGEIHLPSVSQVLTFSSMRMSTAPIGHHITIRGQGIWTHTAGKGDPDVIFVPGAGSFGLDFALVQERVSKFATAILYDRAGTGWSDNAALPRTAIEVTDELRAVLLAIAGPGPHVLVGHSLGGAYVQRFAQRFPAEVAGLVLLDPAHEDWNLYMPEDLQIRAEDMQEVELPPKYIALVREQFTPIFSAFPEAIRADVIERHLGADRLMAGVREGLNFLDVLGDLRTGGSRPDVPLILLQGTAIDPSQAQLRSEVQLQAQIDASRRLYESVVDAAPEGEYREVPGASHAAIPMVAPDAVAAAVKDVVERGSARMGPRASRP
jgi:pimeloyl-ACP methyl ester carboxylesterase